MCTWQPCTSANMLDLSTSIDWFLLYKCSCCMWTCLWQLFYFRQSLVESSSSIGDIITSFQERAVETNTKTELIIFRRKVLESGFRGISRPTFKLNSRIYVKFSGEIGEDHGGPRREFFRYDFTIWCLFRSSVTVHLGFELFSSLNHEMNQSLTKRKLMSPQILH